MPNTDEINLLYREDLEAELPSCACNHPRFLRPACHPRAQMRAAYTNGMLALFCSACEAPVFAVKVCGRLPVN